MTDFPLIAPPDISHMLSLIENSPGKVDSKFKTFCAATVANKLKRKRRKKELEKVSRKQNRN